MIQNSKQKNLWLKWRKPLLILIFLVVGLVALVVVFVSPIAKYMVEKYDTEYTGREIEMDRAYVNPFTGFIKFNNFRIYENQSDSVFFSAKDLSVNVALFKLLSKTYEISRVTINQPSIKILQEKEKFNFNDLLAKFAGEDDSTQVADTTAEALRVNILKIKIKDGAFYYNEGGIPIETSITKLNIESPGMRWNNDTIKTRFSFSSGNGTGEAKGEMDINLERMSFRLATVVERFDLEIINQYLQDFSNYGNFAAILNADLKIEGNFNTVDSTIIVGLLQVEDFHFGKNPDEDFASFDQMTVAMQEVSPLRGKFFFDSISVTKPYFKYEQYDSLSNLETMFGDDGAKIDSLQADPTKFNLVLELADYMKQLSQYFFRSDFMINRLAIYDANLRFEDYAISEKFAIAFNPFTVVADSIDKDKERVVVNVNSGIDPYGKMNVVIGLNPKDTSDFYFEYNFSNIPATLFNPYLISQTSFPLDRGTIELEGTWRVKEGKIDSNNHLLFIDPRLAQKVNSKLTKWIPMKLIMAFVRERGNVIDYQIPIKGDLNDPKFKLADVVLDVVKNIFIKPVTTAYRMELKTVETRLEKSLALNWDMRQASLGRTEERFVKSMVDFLDENPEAIIEVTTQYYDQKEKEYILFFEAKKKYFATKNNLTHTPKNPLALDRKDSLKIDQMSIKDPAFIKYIDSQINDSLVFTIQEKCARFIDSQVVDSKYNQLKKAREERFLAHFKDQKLGNRVKILQGKVIVPFNGFSYYKIDYEGDFPDFLLEAYEKMNKLNNQPPREKYNEERT